jgi:hypothetical protein
MEGERDAGSDPAENVEAETEKVAEGRWQPAWGCMLRRSQGIHQVTI